MSRREISDCYCGEPAAFVIEATQVMPGLQPRMTWFFCASQKCADAVAKTAELLRRDLGLPQPIF